MSKIIASLALLVLLAVGRGADAAEATGWITHLDQQADRIVLDDGRVFTISEEINFSSLKDGVKVWIRYDAINGDKIATEILPAPKAPQSAARPQSGIEVPNCVGDNKKHLTRHSPIPSSAFC
jgi:hypothetical protein